MTSGVVKLEKDPKNLVGVSVGGGAPNCPCTYIVQVLDGSPASRDGSLKAGDEIVGINGNSVKGRTKTEVARLIQVSKVAWVDGWVIDGWMSRWMDDWMNRWMNG